jgi:hypothetical protein
MMAFLPFIAGAGCLLLVLVLVLLLGRRWLLKKVLALALEGSSFWISVATPVAMSESRVSILLWLMVGWMGSFALVSELDPGV